MYYNVRRSTIGKTRYWTRAFEENEEENAINKAITTEPLIIDETEVIISKMTNNNSPSQSRIVGENI